MSLRSALPLYSSSFHVAEAGDARANLAFGSQASTSPAGMPPSQVIQVSLPGSNHLIATFIPDSATASELVARLLDEDGAIIQRAIFGSAGSPATVGEVEVDHWAIQACVSSKPNTERTEEELQQLEERASFASQERATGRGRGGQNFADRPVRLQVYYRRMLSYPAPLPPHRRRRRRLGPSRRAT